MVEKINKFLTTLTLFGIFLPAVLWTNFTTGAAEPEKPVAGQREVELFETAYKFHMSGELEKAIHFYKLSIEKKPTAKAHTFLGWALSHQGKYDEAIAECLKAIELDPEYGNPTMTSGLTTSIRGCMMKPSHFSKRPWRQKTINTTSSLISIWGGYTS